LKKYWSNIMALNKDRLKLGLIDNVVWVICIVLYITFSIARPRGFIAWQNIETILYVGSMLGFLVLAEALVLLSGNMDLSLAENAGLSAMVGGYFIKVMFPGISGWVGIFVVIATGGLLGAINGYLVGKRKFNAFLATLSTYLIFDWATYWIRRGVIVKLPDIFVAPGGYKIGRMHIAIIIFLVVALVLHLFLTRTEFGLNIYAVGGNPKTTEMMGIRVDNVIMGVFTLAGVLAGISGLLYVGYIDTVTSLIAQGRIFDAFAGAIIGGISLRGGRGTIMGALGGVVMLGIIDAGLTMLMISPEARGVLNGFVLLVAIAINMYITKVRDSILVPR
jgi:ribose/xylose/arabinose/galactoside ABC-type transport system permease subunit